MFVDPVWDQGVNKKTGSSRQMLYEKILEDLKVRKYYSTVLFAT